MRLSGLAVWVSVLALAGGGLRAEEAQDQVSFVPVDVLKNNDERAAVTPAVTQKCPYDYCIKDGLYATITSMGSLKSPDVKAEQKFTINVAGFKKDLDV